MKVRVLAYKSVKRLSRLLKRDLEPLKTKFGSADYRNAGPLREIFVKVINEDLAEAARRIDTPCLLIYGARDSETPPDIGRRLSKLINRSELCVLANQDHYSVLDSGRHQVIKRISEFCGKL